MVITFCGDLHLSVIPPVSRKITYFDEILSKLQEFLSDMADIIIINGDVFHRKRKIQHLEVNTLIKVLNNYRKGSEYGRKIFVNLGNHDIDNAQVIDKNPVMSLVFSDLVQILDYYIIQDSRLIGINDIDNMYEYWNERYKQDIENTCRDIVFVHLDMFPDVVPSFFDTGVSFLDFVNNVNILCKEKRELIVIAGHIHDFFGEKTYKNAKYVNYGSIARTGLGEKRLDRKIGYGKIYLDKNRIDIRFCPLKNYKPYTEVFTFDERNESELFNKASVDYVKMLASLNSGNLSNFITFIEEAMNTNNLAPEVRRIVFNYLGIVK